MKKYDNFVKALTNLHEGIETPPPYSVVELTGILGLFSICFEQVWKVMKEILEEHGLTTEKNGSPKAILKIAHQCGLIDDQEGWLGLLRTRNALSHIYDANRAEESIELINKEYLPLLDKLQHDLEPDWLLV